MQYLLILALLGIPDGSVICLEHSKAIVEKVTESEITHVAIVFDDIVYEATPPNVRKTSWEAYYLELLKEKKKKPNLQVWIATPKIKYNKDQIDKMTAFADSQIGVIYSIKGYTKGIESGLHCAQFVTQILSQSGRFWSRDAGRVTPKTLWLSIENKYIKGNAVPLR